MIKKIRIMVLLGLMVPTLIYGKDINLVVNGEQVNSNVAPIIREGTTIVPLKVIATQLGAQTSFDAKNKKVIVIKDGKCIELPIGENIAIVNGEKYTLQTPAVIINGTTMVPVRFVAEHLACITRWDSKNNTVIVNSEHDTVITNPDGNRPSDIKSEIQPPKDYMDEAIKILENKITFTNDIELFTLYAFMNYTGYTEENNKEGFSFVRKSVIEDLNNMNLSLKDENYYKNRQVRYSDYILALRHMDKAPYFSYKLALPDYLEDLKDLPTHLQKFYEEANIEALYKKYEEEYIKEQEKYKELVCPAIAKINYYLKLDNEEVSPFVIQINLLEAYWRGNGLNGKTYYYNGKEMIIAGPSYEPNVGIMVHEYLHSITTPIVRSLKEVERLAYLRPDVPVGSQADEYGDWVYILDESIIRGIEGKAVDEDARDGAQLGYDEGFILTLYFYERFDEFTKYNGSLEEFIKKLIVEYK